MPAADTDAFKRSAPARREIAGDLRRDVVAFARDTGADEDTCQRVALAVAEAINNAVIHAYVNTDVGPVAVEVWSDRDAHLHVRVCDEGAGMVPRPDSPGLGLGLPLMPRWPMTSTSLPATIRERWSR